MQKRFAAVILAAGLAERFGSPKIMLDWHGEPLVRHIVNKVMGFGLSPIIVVVGAVIDPVQECLSGLPVELVVNENYKTGVGTSFTTGISAIQQGVDGAFIFLGDQPFLDKKLIEYMKTIPNEADVLFPTFEGTPGHPVLWKAQIFSRIRQMGKGETGRSLQKKVKKKEIPWLSNKITLDIDTPEDYDFLISGDID